MKSWVLKSSGNTQTRPAILRAPGQATEIASWHATLAVTWQEFRTSRRLWCLPRAHAGILSLPEWWPAFLSHQPGHSALHLCCLSTQVIAAQLRLLFLPSSFPSSRYCFPLSLRNASWPQSRKSPACSYFPDKISPKSIPHHICIYHLAGFFFSTVETVLDLSPPCHLLWSSSYQIIF